MLRTSPIDQLMAHGQSAVSAVGLSFPTIGKHITAIGVDARIAPVRYTVTKETRADQISTWVPFDGAPESGFLPANYKSVGVMNVNAARFNGYHVNCRHDMVLAVGYTIGNMVMVGELPWLDRDEFMADDPVIRVRIGRQAARFTFGISDSRGGMLYVPDGAVEFAEQISLEASPDIPRSIV